MPNRSIISCIIIVGCNGTKQPEGFLSGLVPVELKLLHQSQPLEADVLLVSDQQTKYRVTGNTDGSGITRFETAINNYSKPGVPAGTYKVLVLIRLHPTIADFTMVEASKKSEAEITQHE